MIPRARKFTIGMTDEERANHRPGAGIKVPLFGITKSHLNLTRSLADVYDIERVGSGKSFFHRWTPKVAR